MGTSTDFSAPPNWVAVKGDVTRSGHQPLTPAKCQSLLRDYVSHSGGARSISSGSGSLGGGSTARNAARNLGGFISSVGRDGLDLTLRANGLHNLIGGTVTEILFGILSLCGGTDGDIDSVDARNALSDTMDELCQNATTPDALEALLQGQANADALGSLLIAYFSNYLYQQFCRVFFAQLEKKHGFDGAASFLSSIKDFIHSSVKNETVGQDLSKVNWFGPDGERVAQTIMQNTLAVFE
jgi:hypothetical protein